MTARIARVGALAAVVLLVAPALAGCRKKVTPKQCDEILDHYADLIVKERYADAGPDVMAAERVRFERMEAKGADEFKNCTTEVQESERACAMQAPTSDALLKCLE